MDEIKILSRDRIMEIASDRGFNPNLILKDYYITLMLYLLRNVKGLYFKGGTAIQKIILDYSRISEDIDFTITTNIDFVKAEIIGVLNETKLFDRVSTDKDVEGFTRLIFHYKRLDEKEDKIFIDINAKGKLSEKPEKHKIRQFYQESIPEFSFTTLALDEMIAEKMAATIGRNKPRDHFDLYKIISSGRTINLGLVKNKCEESGDEFNIIKMFNKANKLKKRWDEDLIPLLAEEITFQEVMKTLAAHFKLKEVKDKQKESKKQK